MKQIYYSTVLVVSLMGLSSCSQEGYETQIHEKIVTEGLFNSGLLSDVDSLESLIVPWEPNHNIVKQRTDIRASYDPYLSDNFYALEGVELNISSRAGKDYYIRSTGGSQPITLSLVRQTTSLSASSFIFYIAPQPSISGIPYLIKSRGSSRLHLDLVAVGQRSDNPDNKVVFLSPNTNSTINASWDIYKSKSHPGYFVIESQSLIGQGDSGNWIDIFHFVWNSQGENNPLGFGKYQQSDAQEFLITPREKFTLEEINYIDEYSAKITEGSYYSVTNSYVNELRSEVSYIMPFEGFVTETYHFAENKGINFSFNNLEKKFKRPTMSNGKITQVSTDVTPDALYTSAGTVTKKISAGLPLNVPPRTKLEITYHFKSYYLETNYEVKIGYENSAERNYRTTKLNGVWSGNIYVDEQIEPTIEITNIDTQKSRIIRPDIKKISRLNLLAL